LTRKPDEIKEILDEEEVSFAKTLDRGEKLFDQYVEKTRERGEKTLNGKDVWRLYDTYGFPVDLTRLMAEELGFDINETEFEEAQAASKEASKATNKKQVGTTLKLDVHDTAALEKDTSIPKTDDSAKFRTPISAILTTKRPTRLQ
jgi:alanyl-tRNA synthetase